MPVLWATEGFLHRPREGARACNGDGLIHQSVLAFIFWVNEGGLQAGTRWHRVSFSPIAREPGRQLLSRAGCPCCREPEVWSPEVALTTGCSSQKEQILLCRSSRNLERVPLRILPGASTPAVAPVLDVSYQSISIRRSSALCHLSWASEWCELISGLGG